MLIDYRLKDLPPVYDRLSLIAFVLSFSRAKKYGETADECGEAFFWCGKALLDLARCAPVFILQILPVSLQSLLEYYDLCANIIM